MNTTKVRIGDVLELVRRPVEIDPASQYKEIGVRSFGRGIFHKEPITGGELGNKRVFYIQAGDLVLSNVFAWEGAVALAGQEEEGRIGSHRFMTYNVNEQIADPIYLSFFFHSEPGLAIIRKASPGSAGRNRTLGIKSFAEQKVELPDLAEQRRIATKLDSLTESIDRVSTARSRMSRNCTSLSESLINELVLNSAHYVRLGDVLESNRSEVDIDPGENYRAIGLRSFGGGIIRYASLPGSELSKLRYFSFPENALVLSNIKAWEGAIAITGEHEQRYVASNRFLFYTPIVEDVSLSYVRHYLLSKRGLRQIGKISPGAADRNRTLGRKSFERMEIPLPEVREQRRVSGILDSVAKRLDQRDDGTHLTALRSSLLNAAFSGRL